MKSEVKAMPSRNQFKDDISKLSHDDLIKIICELCSASADNRRFFEAKAALLAKKSNKN